MFYTILDVLDWNHTCCLSFQRDVLCWTTFSHSVLNQVKPISYCHSANTSHLWYLHPSLTLAICTNSHLLKNLHPLRVCSQVRLCSRICAVFSGTFLTLETPQTPIHWKPPAVIEKPSTQSFTHRSAPQLLKNLFSVLTVNSPYFESHIGCQNSVTCCLRGALDSRLIFVVNIKEQLKLLLSLTFY